MVFSLPSANMNLPKWEFPNNAFDWEWGEAVRNRGNMREKDFAFRKCKLKACVITLIKISTNKK